MRTTHLSMVGGEDDKSIAGQRQAIEGIQYPLDLMLEKGDLTII